jgi:hypothetical protein
MAKLYATVELDLEEFDHCGREVTTHDQDKTRAWRMLDPVFYSWLFHVVAAGDRSRIKKIRYAINARGGGVRIQKAESSPLGGSGYAPPVARSGRILPLREAQETTAENEILAPDSSLQAHPAPVLGPSAA